MEEEIMPVPNPPVADEDNGKGEMATFDSEVPCSSNSQMIAGYVPQRQTSYLYFLLLFPYLLLVIHQARWARYSNPV